MSSSLLFYNAHKFSNELNGVIYKIYNQNVQLQTCQTYTILYLKKLDLLFTIIKLVF